MCDDPRKNENALGIESYILLLLRSRLDLSAVGSWLVALLAVQRGILALGALALVFAFLHLWAQRMETVVLRTNYAVSNGIYYSLRMQLSEHFP